ncbi:MAG: c-type cytochrome [Rhodocyclaceae bacterium]|jgi:cytochrome c|nr:c-type cytochrome [Rhodocyclaceae bacterium]MCO5097029.1 c-type cytochrome [Rhodocyclaceae bacterium]MCZ7654995.1 c-type cytochrome [Rhodocyclaceae bacterium]
MKLIKTLLLAGAGLMIAGQASADEALAKAKNCMSCHAVDKKVVGPSYKDVAKKYAGQADAAAKLEAKVKKGGSGVWGTVPMPPNPAVSDADIKKLVAWVLATK